MPSEAFYRFQGYSREFWGSSRGFLLKEGQGGRCRIVTRGSEDLQVALGAFRGCSM